MNGIIFDRMYTAHICSPSRASAMTGMYAHSIGLQSASIPGNEREFILFLLMTRQVIVNLQRGELIQARNLCQITSKTMDTRLIL